MGAEHEDFVHSIDVDEEEQNAPIADNNELALQSALATENEHSITIGKAIKDYRAAILWSLFFCIGQMMTSFDPQVLGNLIAMPAFQRDFGYLYQDSYIVSAPWQTALLMGGPIGQVAGSLFAAYPMDRYGRKLTFGVCVIGTSSCIFIQFFARSLPVLLVGELIGGLILGFYAVLTPTYASEVCPVALRGIMTANINLFICIGQLLANGICAGTQNLTTHWAYSIPFANQWIWPVVILALLPWAPESPWWLVRTKNYTGATKALKKTMSPKMGVAPTLAMMIKTCELEAEMHTGTSYRDIFTKENGNRRRTEICTGVYTVQVMSGIYLIGYGVYFFEQAGLATADAFYMGIGFLGVGVVGSCLSWGLLILFGRRTIYNWGLALLTFLLLLIGILDCIPNKASTPSIIWAQASILIIWNFFYNLTIGPVGFSILCEISAANVREKTIAFATAVQAAVGIGMTIAVPYLINPDQAALGGKLGFFFGGLAAISLFWAYFRIPETKGRTYGELDALFNLHVPAKKFASYNLAHDMITTDG